MEEARVVECIEGSERVVALFGRWPAFHDAEVVRMLLLASGATFTVEMTLDVPDPDPALRSDGAWRRVGFRFEECDGRPGTWIAGFDGRNALFALDWSVLDAGEIVAVLRPLSSETGVDGRIRCRRVRVIEAARVAER